MFGLLELVTGVVVLLGVLYYYFTSTFSYWVKKGVPYIEPRIPFGTWTDQVLLKEDFGRTLVKWYTKYKGQGLRFVGAFTFRQPNLLIFDLDLCKDVLTKDFIHFFNRDLVPATHECLMQNMFSLEGQEWKDMRIKLTPAFASGKLKLMFPLMKKCAEQLQDYIEEEVLQHGEFEVKNLIVRFTTDIIATCAFGLQLNTVKNKDDDFLKIGKKTFAPHLTTFLKLLYHKNFKTASNIIRVRFIDASVEVMLSKLMKDTIRFRKENNIVRNDFVDLLLEVKNRPPNDTDEGDDVNESAKEGVNHGHDDSGLTMEQMTAQAFAFFAAGSETAASTTSFCLYELAKSPSVQRRLKEEMDQVLSRHGGELTYQALQDMTYTDQVINETLRMYASFPLLSRVCTEDYQVPGTEVVIDKGVKVTVPVYAIHHDPDIYPDPYKFDPSRFSEENAKCRHAYSFIPFGEGPRMCIGMRFGRLQVKTGLVAIMSRYWLSPGPRTPDKLELNPLNVVTTPKHPFSLLISTSINQ